MALRLSLDRLQGPIVARQTHVVLSAVHDAVALDLVNNHRTGLDLVAAAIDDLFPSAYGQVAWKPLMRRRDQVSLLASLVVVKSAGDRRSVGLGAWQRRRLLESATLRGRSEKDNGHAARCHVVSKQLSAAQGVGPVAEVRRWCGAFRCQPENFALGRTGLCKIAHNEDSSIVDHHAGRCDRAFVRTEDGVHAVLRLRYFCRCTMWFQVLVLATAT